MRTHARSRIPAAVVLAALAVTTACRPEVGRNEPSSPPAPAPRSGGQEVLHGDNPALALWLDRIERDEGDMVVVHLVFENRGERPVELANAFAFQPDEAGYLSAVWAADDSGLKRYFPLRGADGVPRTSRLEAPLAPGERQQAWARFGPVPADVKALVVKVPGFPALPETSLDPGRRAAESGAGRNPPGGLFVSGGDGSPLNGRPATGNWS
jgi:hypothetical protein